MNEHQLIWVIAILSMIMNAVQLWISIWDLKVDLQDRDIDIDDHNTDNPNNRPYDKKTGRLKK